MIKRLRRKADRPGPPKRKAVDRPRRPKRKAVYFSETHNRPGEYGPMANPGENEAAQPEADGD